MSGARGSGPRASPEKKRDKRHWMLVGSAWVIVLVAAVLLLVRAFQVPEPADSEELARTARKMRSDAIEAAYIARQLAAGQLTQHYARSHHQMIAHDLEEARQSLEQPPPAGRAEEVEKLRASARRLGTILAEVPPHMADSSAMARIAQDEAVIAREMEPATRP